MTCSCHQFDLLQPQNAELEKIDIPFSPTEPKAAMATSRNANSESAATMLIPLNYVSLIRANDSTGDSGTEPTRSRLSQRFETRFYIKSDDGKARWCADGVATLVNESSAHRR